MSEINIRHSEGVFRGENVPGVRIYARRFHVFIPYSRAVEIADALVDMTETYEQDRDNDSSHP